MQVAIIVMTYVTLLGVMAILQTQFIDVMGDLSSQADGGGRPEVAAASEVVVAASTPMSSRCCSSTP